MDKLGFIGLGNQGAPMAQRMIEAGHELVLWARRPQTLEPFANKARTNVADDVESLARQVQYCAVCVVDDDGVQAVCERLLANMAAGGIVVIHSTVSPELCKTLSEQARTQGLTLIDAPVSGGGAAAAQGTLTVMAGGDAAAMERVRPLFACFANNVFHMGEVGTGQQAKLVNNSLMAANLALAHHALSIADTLGIQRQEFVNMMQVSSGHSFAFNVSARMQSPQDFAHGARLLQKDVNLLGSTLDEHHSYQTIRQATESFLEQALKTKTPEQ